MKKSGGMKATSVRGLLSFVVVLLILGIAGGFYLGLQKVREFSISVNHTVANADASGGSIDELQKLKQALAQSETLVNKANLVFSTEASYQSQALKDVQKYAGTFGITIKNTDFGGATSTVGARSFVITLQSPVDYAKLLQFLDAIEGNLPKMQVATISLNRPKTGDVNRSVETGTITIGISTR
ncbi:MAG: hypothetical protein WAO28_02045 [Candidatus Microsaccharimonas sp.]